ncbi:hypothetical protein PHET_08673 [Paragonimus heterotremus]|uniref:Tyrosine-protein kinase ephrin type A/B receptor-like domain-containing protein n=1 Tax=Paragonimus heterotremus TaxID=100268 RepID=A0A8J4STW1_9TREM|nr:hypothetical protein PHET_08673 [Paragonimus heterotremus]
MSHSPIDRFTFKLTSQDNTTLTLYKSSDRMNRPFYLILIALFLQARGEKVQHTVWLPAGKQVRIPCKLRSVEKSETFEWWAQKNANLTMDFASNSIAAWYDRLGQLIHVGEILLVHVPAFEASELSVTQYVPRETAPNEKPMSLIPEYKNWIGGVNQLLEVHHMDSVTCSELQASTVIGFQQTWQQFERETHIGNQIFFTFRIYAQPLIIWNYAVPPEIEFENRSVLLKPIEEWCSKQRSIRKYVTNICSTIYEQRRPFIKLTSPTETMPLVQSTGLGYIEVGIVIDLSNPPLNLLASPTDGELGYLHAQLKHSLDTYILVDLERQINVEDVDETITVATRIQAICPPGSHTYMAIPALRNLNLESLLNNTLKESSASALLSFQMLCHPCADGQAPRAPYAFDRCHSCPRGYYLGSTGWPSSAGCLPCPEGFTTDKIGATSIEECKLNAGAVTRWTLDYLLHTWFALERIIAGRAGPDTQTRALGQHQQSAWAWLGKTDKTVWMGLSVYGLLIFWLTAMAIYRLHLYYRLQSIFKKQYRLLLKAALIGQINLVSHIKQRAKQGGMTSVLGGADDLPRS